MGDFEKMVLSGVARRTALAAALLRQRPKAANIRSLPKHFSTMPARLGGGGLKSLGDLPDTPAPYEEYFTHNGLWSWYAFFSSLIVADIVYFTYKVRKDSNGKHY